MEDISDGCKNNFIEEEVYIKNPNVIEVHDKETHICKLNMELYGLKQSL